MKKLTSVAMFNTLNKDRSLYQTTARYMKSYLNQFGPEALANVFNSIMLPLPGVLWRADKVVTKVDLRQYSAKDMGEMYQGINYGSEVTPHEE
jgi:hypothetical protein